MYTIIRKKFVKHRKTGKSDQDNLIKEPIEVKHTNAHDLTSEMKRKTKINEDIDVNEISEIHSEMSMVNECLPDF